MLAPVLLQALMRFRGTARGCDTLDRVRVVGELIHSPDATDSAVVDELFVDVIPV